MCIANPMFMHHLMKHHKESIPSLYTFFDPYFIIQKNIDDWNNLVSDLMAFVEMFMKMIQPKPEVVEEVRQTYSVEKRNKNLVIVNSNGEVVYHPPHFIQKVITSRDCLKKLADVFTEKNETNIDAIKEFEASLR